MSAVNLRLSDCMEELVKFTLESHINETLEFDPGLSKSFCSDLLKHDPNSPTTGNISLIHQVLLLYSISYSFRFVLEWSFSSLFKFWVNCIGAVEMYFLNLRTQQCLLDLLLISTFFLSILTENWKFCDNSFFKWHFLLNLTEILTIILHFLSLDMLLLLLKSNEINSNSKDGNVGQDSL